MIQVYTGDGKGKTTAALGLAMRAAGHGFKVRVIQFMKGNTYSGEIASAEKLGIEFYQFGRTCPHAAVIKSGFMQCIACGKCWIGLAEITELDRQKIEMAWQFAKDSVSQGEHDLLILDEIMSALNKGLVKLDQLLELLKQAPADIEIVLTGRDTPDEVVELADLVSEIKEIKHPFKQGVASRRGIEY